MLRRVLLILLAASAVRCDRFTIEEATFVVHNTSNDKVEFIVDAGESYTVPANDRAKFTRGVQVPKGSGNYTTPTFNSDKIVTVSVSVKNLTTGRLLEPIMCDAGAKVTEYITYSREGGYNKLSCTRSYTYGWW